MMFIFILNAKIKKKIKITKKNVQKSNKMLNFVG